MSSTKARKIPRLVKGSKNAKHQKQGSKSARRKKAVIASSSSDSSQCKYNAYFICPIYIDAKH